MPFLHQLFTSQHDFGKSVAKSVATAGRYPQIAIKSAHNKSRASFTATRLRFVPFHYDSYWARTSDLYPVKVALSQLSFLEMPWCRHHVDGTG